MADEKKQETTEKGEISQEKKPLATKTKSTTVSKDSGVLQAIKSVFDAASRDLQIEIANGLSEMGVNSLEQLRAAKAHHVNLIIGRAYQTRANAIHRDPSKYKKEFTECESVAHIFGIEDLATATRSDLSKCLRQAHGSKDVFDLLAVDD